MAAHAAAADGSEGTRLPCAMVGVGAAFDMFGGRTRNAPGWMQGAGLEWAYRLASEPRRLWRRQLRNNPRFVVLFLRQLARARTCG
jgi:N-acetylglucosaminyldiphosphoundecaprenol N-acetyl-beta-D-mannosaminyltransferase